MYRKLKKKMALTALCLCALTITACSEKSGSLLFTANGEEFIAEGLVSKEGFTITFDQVLINLSNIEAYSINDKKLSAKIEGDQLIDLKKGTVENPVITVQMLNNVSPGNYQSLRYSLKQLQSGEYSGYSIILKGTASKDNQAIPFSIKLNEELLFDGREGYVGDSVKGIVKSGETSDVEMTFHFDHLFGNIEADKNDHVNSGSPGFELFRPYIQDGKIDVNQNQLTENPAYPVLIGAIETLGHLGEGHCEVLR
jgi:hypothetical protein